MFFKDIDTWSKKKLALVTLICGLIYLVFATVIPTIIIGCKYGIFKNTKFSLTGGALVCIVILVTVGFKACNWLFGLLPQTTQKQQCFRYTLEMLGALIIPAIALWVIHLIKVNVNLACDTLTWCIVSWIGAIIVNNVTLKTLKYQWSISSKVDELEKINRVAEARKSK